MTATTIWCLFSVENDYDQPDNNLVRFWLEKPSIETLAKFLGRPMETIKDEELIKVVSVWQGTGARFGNTDYRLQEVTEGESL